MSRLAWIDIIKGICILQMVAFHTFMPFVGTGYLISITIPCFFFVSGLFFKEKLITVFKAFDKLIVPYVVTFISYNLLNFLLTGDKFCLPRSIWFLYVMFGVIVIYYVICKAIKNILARDFVCIALFLIGFYMGTETIDSSNNPLSQINFHGNFEPIKLGSIFSMIFIFHIGHRLSEYILTLKCEYKYSSLFFLKVVLLGGAFLILMFVMGSEVFLSVCYNSYRLPFIEVLVLLAFNIAVLMVASKIINQNTVLQFYGRYSLIILCLHIFILKFIDNTIGFILIVAVVPAIVSIIERYIPYLFGLSDSIGVKCFNWIARNHVKFTTF